MTMRKCVVPICKNKSSTHPNKIFLRVPANKKRQELWARALKIPAVRRGGSEYVCEDHFNFSEDCSNWTQYKMMGKQLLLKPDVVPHQFLTEKCPESKSQLTDSEKKRKRSFLESLRSTSYIDVMNKPKSYNRGSGKTYCRFCLQPCAKNTTTPLSDVNFNYPGKNYVFKQKKMEKMKETNKMLKFCLPFYDSLTFNPVMCSICLGKLKVAYEFSQMCCKSQQLIEKYAETYSATEKVINLNEMLETKVKPNDDETMSGTETFSHIPQVTTTSQKRKYPNDNDSPRKKQKAYSETYEDDSTNSSDNTSNIKIEPDDDALTEYLKIEPDDENNGCGFMERLTDDVPHKINEEEIKVEPNYIDCPDFIKREQVDLHEEHKVFDERTGIGTHIERQHLYHQGPGNVSVDANNVPLLVKGPTFSNG